MGHWEQDIEKYVSPTPSNYFLIEALLLTWTPALLILAIILAIWVLKQICLTLLRQCSPSHSLNQDLGPWALVTGATDGIGKEYATQLAAKGVNIVLISRSRDKLGDLSTHLNSLYDVQVRTVAVDFTKGQEIYSEILLALEGLEITTLINNVGMSYPAPSYFHELEDKPCMDILNCNILSTTLMIKMLLPSMVARSHGFIINVGSLASEVSFPFLSLYAATKSFVDKLSNDLHLEYGNKGIFIQSLVPCSVATKMSHIQRPSFFVPSTEEFVSSALVDLAARKRRTPGYFAHSLQMVWFRFLRIAINSWFDKWNYGVMNRWRVAALAKRR